MAFFNLMGTSSQNDTKDKKTEIPPVIQAARPKTLLEGRGKIKGAKLRVVTTKLCYSVNNTAVANTANVTAIPLEPASTTSWSNWAAVYEEVKVHSAEFHFNVEVTGSGAVPTGTNLQFALSYNPINSIAQTSTAATMESSQAKMYSYDSQTSTTVGAGGFGGAIAASRTGLFDFKMKVPAGGQARSSAASTTFSGEWSNTNDGADIYGWITPYIPAPGANNQTTIYGVLVMNCSFRSRY